MPEDVEKGTAMLTPRPTRDGAPMSAAPDMDPELARRVRFVILDVDGVLTDGGVYIGRTGSGDPVELKRFDIQDGIGIKLMQDAGLDVVLVSGRESAATELRAGELGVPCYQIAGGYKLRTVERILAEYGVEWEQVAMLGDDLPDMALLKRVGLPAAVGNNTEEIEGVVRWRARARGGHGAIREFARSLLQARGEWADAVDRYVREREEYEEDGAGGP